MNTTTQYRNMTEHMLSDDNRFHSGTLPDSVMIDDEQFRKLWEMHPEEYHEIMIHGRWVKTPRWQQAYEQDYHYSKQNNRAMPAPPLLKSLLQWSQQEIDRSLSGILVNWYDGELKHYIGAHRDSTVNMVPDSPIVTISFGEERVFRLRQWKGRGYRDFPADDGTVFIMPYDTNKTWTHEVPHFQRFRGRRISVTLRAFEADT